MKITSTFMAILMVCAVLVFNTCDDPDSVVNDKTHQLLSLLPLGQTYTIGETGPSGVGIVFYITDGGLHGLEAAPVDQSIGVVWISGTFQSLSTGATGTAIGTGLSNSNIITGEPLESPSAAQLCRNYRGGGKTDWFFPSKDELNQLYLQQAVVGGFAASAYWSSSEGAANGAWGQGFPVGPQVNVVNKNDTLYVRAVRAF